MQNDRSTLIDVYQQLLLLVRHIENLGASVQQPAGNAHFASVAVGQPHMFAPLCRPLRSIILKHWQKHMNKEAIIMCATFSFDTNYTSLFSANLLDSAITWFTSWGALFIKEYGMSDETDGTRIQTILTQQLSAFKGGTSPFSALQTRKQVLLTGARENRWDPREVWVFYKESAPEITACALALLSLTASEAAVERTFSKQGLVHSKLRNALSAQSVQAQMFIAFNYRALARRAKQVDSKLEDDDVELNAAYDNSFHTTNLFLARLSDDAIRAVLDEPVPAGVDAEAQPVEMEQDQEEEDEKAQAEEYGDDEEVVENEAKAEEEEKDEEEAEEEPEQKAEREDPIRAFIREYVSAKRITHGFRWGGDAMNTLQATLIAKGLTITTDDMKLKIKAYVMPVAVPSFAAPADSPEFI